MALNHTYINAASDTAGALGAAGEDVRIFKILVGNPADAGTVTVFNTRTAYAAQTANIAYKLTQPTAAAGKNWIQDVDFGPEGLPVDGGNVMASGTQGVTVIWGNAPGGGV